ncbi:hypothetical protein E2C01_041160 [Portunus trituberculatus]|uniref:Uncharacterized protein n=1 Tax=Portunus trituberculatus TaxID=210409 RepID=A0A5B7FPM3_PORTR|nr:hypothetical protein [Portunus trituberculatus]
MVHAKQQRYVNTYNTHVSSLQAPYIIAIEQSAESPAGCPDEVSGGAAELVIVGKVQKGVPEAVERHEPRGNEEQLFEGSPVVDTLLQGK